MLKYTEDHEWLRVEGDEIVFGITSHAAEQLGDLVFVELPDVGREVEAGEDVAVVESVKAATDVTTPIAGTITAVNDDIVDDPTKVNADPETVWFFRLKAPGADLSGLMDKDAYDKLVG